MIPNEMALEKHEGGHSGDKGKQGILNIQNPPKKLPREGNGPLLISHPNLPTQTKVMTNFEVGESKKVHEGLFNGMVSE